MITSHDQVNIRETEIATGFEKFLINIVEGSKFPKVKKVLYGSVSKAVHFVKNLVAGKVETTQIRGTIEQLYIDVRNKSESLSLISFTIFRNKDGEIDKETFELRNKVLRDGPFVTSRICPVEEIQILQTEISEFVNNQSKEVNIYFDLISAYALFDEKLKIKSVYTFIVDGEKRNALNIIKMTDGKIQIHHVHNIEHRSVNSSVFLVQNGKNDVKVVQSKREFKDFKFGEQDMVFRVAKQHFKLVDKTQTIPEVEIDEMMNSAIMCCLMN